MFSAANFWPLVLIVSAVVLNAVFVSEYATHKPYRDEVLWDKGGPMGTSAPLALFGGTSLALAHQSKVDAQTFPLSGSSAALAPSYPITNLVPTRNGLRKYKIKKGDTLSGIAAAFGISLDTIRFANPGMDSAIRPGEEIIILPVSGIVYEVRSGDSLELIASKYAIDPTLIKTYNPTYQKLFESPGETVIVPYAKPSKTDYAAISRSKLPDLKTYFSLPARGWNWGELHEENAVDIADACGKSIYAAQEGIVIEESSNNLWNRGYGNYVFIEHPNGVKTRYAHNAKNMVKIGEYVDQGQEIARIGNTGSTHGPSGCHVHFEVIGARNPFAIK